MTPAEDSQSLLLRTLRDPQEAARRLLALDIPAEARWIAVLLVAVLAVISLDIALWMVPEAEPSIFSMLANPWLGMPLQVFSILTLAAVMTGAGRPLGGRGAYADALTLVVWIEFVMVVAQAVQIASMLVLPPLSLLVSITSLVLFIWLMVHFTAVLHGLTNLGQVVLALIVGFVAVVVLAAVVLAVLGITPQTAGV
jgi:hypothetical protein